MSKRTSIIIVLIILLIMGVAAGIVISLFENMKATLVGNKTNENSLEAQYIQINEILNAAEANNIAENSIDENVVSNNVVNEVISQNTIVNIGNEVTANLISQNVVLNDVVENTIIEEPVNQLKSQIVDTGVISNLGDSTAKLMVSTYDVYSIFISTYVGGHNSEVLNSYDNRDYFASKNLGIIYVPLRNTQNFDISELKVENNKLMVTYRYAGVSDGPATRGYLILIETDKSVTDIDVKN